ncbi:MAG TPA: metalloregulator ArsR/SmtB family transcription factor [Gemmataceae bacterium]|nr:metalloregulator ArsR/SmtB family transcription factor [Gemmataceae bacterium]
MENITGPPTTRPSRLPTFHAAAEYLRCIAHPHRLRTIELMLAGRYTLGELAASCDIPSAAASEHLRLMHRCGLVAAERDGRRLYYRVVEPGLLALSAGIRE